MYEMLPIQWDPSRPPKLPYKIKNRQEIQWTPPGKVYTKLFRQPYEYRWFSSYLGPDPAGQDPIQIESCPENLEIRISEYPVIVAL